MQALILIILVGLAGGVAVGLQSPLASIISQRIGVMESIFIVHAGGAVAVLPGVNQLQRRTATVGLRRPGRPARQL